MLIRLLNLCSNENIEEVQQESQGKPIGIVIDNTAGALELLNAQELILCAWLH